MNAMEPTTAAVMAADGLTARYGRVHALEDVSFRVEPGKVYALLGRNGAGKSTLVRCLLGFQKADRGSSHLFGQDVWRHRARLMARIGVVPEEADMPPRMTADQLSDFFRRLYPTWDGASVLRRLERFGVPRRQAVGSLSKGQKRHLSLALALASGPELVVMDDPTLGLDPVARVALYDELLAELSDRGTTVFLTTHDLAGIEGIADRVGVLLQGRLVLDEDLESLKGRFRRLRRQGPIDGAWAASLASLEPLTVRERPFGQEAVVARFDEARWAPGEGVTVDGLSLEAIFLAVAGGEA